MQKQGVISTRELAQAQLLHTRAMQGLVTSQGALGASSSNVAAQISDITQTLSLGINPFVVFGQQAGQLSAALAGTANKATLLGRAVMFLASGPGSILIGAITVIGLLATTMGKAEDASDDLAGALDFQRMSAEALTKAIAEQRKEAEDSIALSYQQITAARELARANLEAALSERRRLAATLDRARVEQRNAGGEASTQVRRVAVDDAQRDLANNAAAKAELERILRLREIPIVRREIEAATDKATAATLRAEKAEIGLNKQYADGVISKGLYERQLDNIGRKRDADIEAIRAQEREQKKLNRETQKAGELAEFVSPVAGGRVTSGLSRSRRNPVTGKVQPHNGIDIAAGFGTAVTAPQVGVVKAVGYSSSLGKYVVIDHGAGTVSRYGHLSDNSFVTEGQTVAQRQRIGSVGSTGRSTGNHLHYEVLVNGKPVDPGKGKFLIDDVKIAEAADKAAKDLEAFGSRAGEAIARVTERFDEQPRIIDQAAAATRQLDEVIKELGERKPIGFEQMIAEAEAAKGIIVDSLLRPFEELEEASERRMQIERLIAANREDEAEALQIIFSLEEKLGPLSDQRKRDVVDMVTRERELSEVLEARREVLNAYLSASRSIRGEIEAILSGQGKLSNFKDIFKNLSGKVLTEKLFGSIFRDFDKFVKEETAISSSVDLMTGETERAGEAAGTFADALGAATDKVLSAAAGRSAGGFTLPGFAGSPSSNAIKAGFAGFNSRMPGGTTLSGEDIVVTAIKGGVNGLSPERYFAEMTRRITAPLLDGLDELLGTKFFGGLDTVIGGGISGYLTAGPAGGVLGALGGIKGLPEGLQKALGGALKGAQTGTMVSGVGSALGIKNSKLGAQLGGAAGSFLPIPGGEIIGAIAGGLLGGLFKKTARTSANLTSVDGAASFSGSSKYQGVAGDAAGAVQSALKSIIEQLGGSAGNFAVSIGQSGDSFHVDTSGQGRLRKSQGGKDFDDDQAAAVAYAIADAIADGAVKGISPAVAKALRSDPDIDKAVAEALKVKDLEKQLAQLDNPLAGLFDEFLNTAKDRVELARKYGLDLNKVEKLNAREREAIVDQAIERQVGGLKSLLEDLNFGSLFEGSAVDRRQKILSEIGDAKQDVGAGVEGAANRLADLERQLVETSRAAFGTAGPEYASDLDEARTTAERIIKEEERRIREAAEATKQGLDLQNETNDLLAGVNGRLDTLIGAFNGAGGTDANIALYFRNERNVEKAY